MPNTPPDEVWWERFFFDREKAVERLLARREEVGIDQALEEMEDSLGSAPEPLFPGDPAADDAIEPDDGFEAFEDDFDADEDCDGEDEEPMDEDFPAVPEWARGGEELAEDVGGLAAELAGAGAPADAFLAAASAAAHAAGAESLGYEDDSLCGTIVKWRWADDQLRVATCFLEGHPLADPFLPAIDALRARCGERVIRLRERAWWQKPR